MNSIKFWLLVTISLSLYTNGNCIKWHMHPNSQKCLKEELRQNELVSGEYVIAPVEGQFIDYVVSIL